MTSKWIIHITKRKSVTHLWFFQLVRACKVPWDPLTHKLSMAHPYTPAISNLYFNLWYKLQRKTKFQRSGDKTSIKSPSGSRFRQASRSFLNGDIKLAMQITPASAKSFATSPVYQKIVDWTKWNESAQISKHKLRQKTNLSFLCSHIYLQL